MSIPGRRSRELYRVYEEDDFFAAQPLAGAPAADAASESPVQPGEPDSGTTTGGPAVGRAMRRRLPAATLIAAGVGLLVLTVIELQATVGRPVRPLEPPRRSPAGAKAGRSASRPARRAPAASRSRRPQGRRRASAQAGTTQHLAKSARGSTAGAAAGAVLSSHSTGLPGSTREFGFEP